MSDQTIAVIFSVVAFGGCSVMVVVSHYFCRTAVQQYAKARALGAYCGAAAIRDARLIWSMDPRGDVVDFLEMYADALEDEARDRRVES